MFGTYKIRAIRDREEDGRVEIVMTQETPLGLHTLVASYAPGVHAVMSERDKTALPGEIRIEGYGFVEVARLEKKSGCCGG